MLKVGKDELRTQNNKLLKTLVYAVHTKEIDKTIESLLISRGESLASMFQSLATILSSRERLVSNGGKWSSTSDKLVASLVASHLAADISYRKQFDAYMASLLYTVNTNEGSSYDAADKKQ